MTDPADIDAARRRLARAEAGLLDALVAAGPVPDGFDAERVRIQARALVAKRREVACLVSPGLAAAVGPRFRELFDAYARASPKPAGGARADVAAFVQTLPRDLRPRPARRWLRRRLRPAILKHR
ncbi:hypothetical protein G9H71_22580 [Motilibacter sp. E257]|uniref:SCO6045-like C-terminal domain-containing protein n=1 Tax=Motilibacter deserti TaxID=2714956 RepID=A0ABX0H008_9ACTN|nr:hypothetical protein [Motilibacter deserti]NHC16573.1 hypothetical protein [Motilibacter deserti]